jgi:hypothetical protein
MHGADKPDEGNQEKEQTRQQGLIGKGVLKKMDHFNQVLDINPSTLKYKVMGLRYMPQEGSAKIYSLELKVCA